MGLVVATSASASAAPVTRPTKGVLVSPAAQAPAPAPKLAPGVGARSAGDELFPTLGNGGYNALHYDLSLGYTPILHQLGGTTTMAARTTQSLREFSMDFQGFDISALTVDGVSAPFTREDT